jgi:thymidylate synthase (FAD)
MAQPTVKLVATTQGAGELINKNAQEVISFITRVSNPNNQMNFETSPKLLAYCIRNGHWSPFEHAYMTLEIETTRAIAAQILRHRSFVFQEFSQRYAKAAEYEECQARRQDPKNRQNSTDDLGTGDQSWFSDAQKKIWDLTYSLYNEALEKGIAKECARFLLPLNTKTRIYMTGNARSWVHYIELRSAHGTQKEHMDIALGCRKIFIEQFPDIARGLEWNGAL